MMQARRLYLALGIGLGLSLPLVADETAETAEGESFLRVRDSYLMRAEPMRKESNLAWWEANVTGSEAAFERKRTADEQLMRLHSLSTPYQRLQRLRKHGEITNPLLQRQLDVMYRAFLPAQANPDLQEKLIKIESDMEMLFNRHRGTVNGTTMSENDLRKILGETRDSTLAKAAWKAYMAVGQKTAGRLRAAVRLRNTIAKELGYAHFFEMQLALQEIDMKSFNRLFDELDRQTREPFAVLKADIDRKMARRFKIAEADLRPWHYGDLFFQEAPDVVAVDLDSIYANVDLLDMVKRYYASMELPCEAILARSDLYEKDGKSPHAFCIDIDRAGDVRVLCNLKPNAYWADTLVHEVGHAVYDEHIDRSLPYLLREASHSITTEGAAMMLGAMVKNADFLTQIVGLDPAKAVKITASAEQALRIEKLIFSRWTQVMMRFEQEMYVHPHQDLAAKWWELKQRYQLMNPPDDPTLPGYAAKVHVLTAPVYYHSYMMGDLFAAQVHAHVARKVLDVDDPAKTSFAGRPEAGKWLKTHIFGPGNRYPWQELTERATGEPLNPRHFVERFVKQP